MPIYEYRCKTCGHHLEALQKVSDGPLRKCPECGKLALQKLISAPVFRLKGGGWYETDFKSDSEKKRNLVESGDGGAKEAADGGKADSGAKEKTETAAKPAKEAKPSAKPAKSKPGKKAAVSG